MRVLIVLLMLSSGCGLFAAETAVPAILAVMQQIAKVAKEKTGKRLDELPVTCEQETIPPQDGKPGELLMLCTVILEPNNG